MVRRVQSSNVRLVLASQSAARAGLLRAAGYAFDQIPAGLEEPAPEQVTTLESHVLNVARLKALATARCSPNAFVLGADTALLVDGRIAGKAADARSAVRMLVLLAGKTHRISTGVCVVSPSHGPDAGCIRSGVASARVTLRPWPETRIRAYVEAVRPFHCAGAYALQGDGAAIIERVQGDPSVVVGLPMGLVEALLADVGYRNG